MIKKIFTDLLSASEFILVRLRLYSQKRNLINEEQKKEKQDIKIIVRSWFFISRSACSVTRQLSCAL